MELLTIYTALLRRKWLVIQSLVFFVAAAAVLAVLLPKNYVATTRVLINSSDTSLSILSELGLSEVATSLSSASDDIQNKVALSTTRPVLDEVIWKLQLRNSDGRLITAEELLIAGTFGELLATPNIAISNQQSTDILLFEARSDDPELSRLLADTVVDFATKQSQERSREDTVEARKFISAQITIVRDEFDRALSDIASAQASEQVIDIESEMKAAIARLSELMMAFETNEAAIKETRARLAEQRNFQAREGLHQVSPGTVAVNQRIAGLQSRLAELRGERANERTTKTEKHPDVLRVDALIRQVEGEIEDALREQHELDPAIQQLDSQLAGLMDKGAEIRDSIQRTTEEFSAYPDKMRKLAQLKLTADAAEAVYLSLLEQSFEVGVAEAMLVSDLQLIEAAKAPDKHDSPKLLVNLILGVIAGMGFGAGLVFVFEYIDDSVQGPDQLAEIWELPRLGIIPKFKGSGERRAIHELDATHPVVESYRTVRNGLLFASLDKVLQVIAVSSSVPGEGKSTFATNLAVSFARDGKSVVVVDLDLRRPTQHRVFPTTSNHIGLADVLAGRAEIADAVQATPVDNLTLLTSGPLPADPGRLVESLRLRQVLIDLRKRYDVVIVDTPPILVVNDALVIARAVDGMVIVVESAKTGRKLLTDTKTRCAAAGVEPVGLVLNKMDFVTAGYGQYAKAYKAYYSDKPKAAEPRSGGAA